MYYLSLIFLVPVLLAGISGCQGYSITGGPGKTVAPSLMTNAGRAGDLVKINSILVAPVDLDHTVRRFDTAAVDFNGKLRDVVKDEISLKVFYAEDGKLLNPSRALYMDQGRKAGADAVLLTRVNNFVLREGSAVGATQPASVNVSMELVRIGDGRSIWQSNYHYRDQALSDNLFRIGDTLKKDGKGPSWKTADELLLAGYREALSDFSRKRLAQFSSGN